MAGTARLALRRMAPKLKAVAGAAGYGFGPGRGMVNRTGGPTLAEVAQRTRTQYLEAKGCETCLENAVYDCPDRPMCSEPHADRFTLEAVRQHLLDADDLRSARDKIEFMYPDAGNNLVQLDSWASYLKSRGFHLNDLPRTARHLSKPLTYPMTIAQFMVAATEYNLTEDGAAAFAALSHRVYEAGDQPVRICVVGARAEAMLPLRNWAELAILCPQTNFELMLVGPEMPLALHNTSVAAAPTMQLLFRRQTYHEIHDQLMVDDLLPDLYVGYNTGIGHPGYRTSWLPSLKFMFETHRPILLTSHNQQDAERDAEFLESLPQEDWRWIVRPSLNLFRSLRCDVHPQDIRHLVWANHTVMAIQGR